MYEACKNDTLQLLTMAEGSGAHGTYKLRHGIHCNTKGIDEFVINQLTETTNHLLTS